MPASTDIAYLLHYQDTYSALERRELRPRGGARPIPKRSSGKALGVRRGRRLLELELNGSDLDLNGSDLELNGSDPELNGSDFEAALGRLL